MRRVLYKCLLADVYHRYYSERCLESIGLQVSPLMELLLVYYQTDRETTFDSLGSSSLREEKTFIFLLMSRIFCFSHDFPQFFSL